MKEMSQSLWTSIADKKINWKLQVNFFVVVTAHAYQVKLKVKSQLNGK